ncbi:hypothetical protein KGA66_13895 [Actinocrinis puniceicyclus]|uniref:Uncharacterized protein n=1 Tax=Actinocrinis puniceicyclus TaxID=977794 RepID=A0A8J8BDH3_9ACTN|nr:hypothetical protein [Actinocrinis puniceicyclus]MBS2964146.1 hypothetical protein [Actinocrinis puniceicyclus]
MSRPAGRGPHGSAAAIRTRRPFAPAPSAAAPAHGIPPLFTGLCDDAAMFPPGNAGAADAVSAHRGHRVAWYRDLVGPFLAAAKHLPAVIEEMRALHAAGPLAAQAPPEPLPTVLVVPDGPGALTDALRAAGPAREAGIELVGVELACDADAAAAQAARRAVAALAGRLPDPAGAVIEVRRGPDLGEALDVVAESAARAKLRTGGPVAAAFPTEQEVACFIVGCVVRGVAFKCTAGLHEAARHTDPATGFEHHGFLNILAATHAACQGADVAAVADVLAERSAGRLAETLRGLSPDAVIRVRTAFTAYGTCSIAEPLADLTRLGLVVPEADTGRAREYSDLG